MNQVRTVVFNLKDPNNPDLRGRVAAGLIPPAALAAMGAEQMASDERRLANANIRKEMAAELVRGQAEMATTDQFQWVGHWGVGVGVGVGCLEGWGGGSKRVCRRVAHHHLSNAVHPLQVRQVQAAEGHVLRE
jgi:hypothetical protein